MERKTNITLPNVKSYKIKELRKVAVPAFQRWLIKDNLKELKTSVNEVGLLRCPVIYRVKELNMDYIIDGNHIRTLLIEDTEVNDNTLINCIFKEVETYYEAALAFKMLNTKGKTLDWIDITNLYMHTHEGGSIYKDIWNIMGNPLEREKIKKVTGFSLATIVEFLSKDKNNYRLGKGERKENYIARKSLLNYLLDQANLSWDIKFGATYRRPTGAAIIGFANYWFTENMHNQFDHADQKFLDIINDIYFENKQGLSSGMFIINRDNSALLMKDYFKHNLV